MRNNLKNIIMIVVGVAFDALGVAAFVLPHNFLAGGVTGVGRVFTHYFGFDVSHVVFVVSIALLAVGWIALGTKFAMTIIAGSVLFPTFLNLFNRFDALTHMTDNAMLAGVFGGGLMGLGLGLLIKAGASSGGSDVIAVILNRKFNMPVAPILYITDFVILIMQLPFASTEDILFGIMVLLICSLTLNKVVLIGSSDVQFTIISLEHKKINAALQDQLDVGSTMLHGKTGHLYNELDVIMCIVTHQDVHRVTKTVLDIDPEAFITMINVNDVKGRGFTMVRKY